MSELTKLIAQAKRKVARKSRLIQFCQGKVTKFRRKFADAKHKHRLAARYKRPKRAAFYQARMARSKRKIRVWTGREATAIELNRSWKGTLKRLLARKAALQPNGQKLVDTARKYLGTNEGSALQRRWAANLSYSASLPWCSIFVANMLLEAGVCAKSNLPTNPAYSGSWIGWSRGRRVNLSERQPGDVVVFDWGDGGITDHVAIYAGGGRHIGGNQSDQVNERPTPMGNIVAVIRPI